MKKIVIAIAFLFVVLYVKAQTKERNFIYAANIGTGIAMSEPSKVPLSLQFLGHYRITERFSAGLGTGLSLYEMPLIPIFADAKFAITRPHKFTPYVECGSGYAFAPSKNAHGGFHLNASVGVQYALSGKIKLHLAAGYELQKLERLKIYENHYFTAEFVEKLSHSSIAAKIGIVF